jgi:hypothetical protein
MNQAEEQPLISSETQAAQSQNQNAQASYNRYTSTEIPLQNQYLSEAEQYNNPAYQQQQAGTAVANVDTAFTGARNQQQQQLSMYGVDPGTARAGAMNMQLGSQQAAAKAAAGTSSTQNTRLTGLNLQGNAENMMAGLPGQSTEEYGGANSAGSTASGNALGLTASGAATEGTATQYAGLQANSLANWGNTLSSQYNAQLGQYQANEQASQALGSGLGSLAGMAIMGAGYAKGGAVPAGYAHGGMAIPDNLSYAMGGPIMPKGVAKIPAFHAPKMGMKLFKPHLMTNSHPHTASKGVGAGGMPRMSSGLSIRGMGGVGAGGGAPKPPFAGIPTNLDGKSGGLPTGGSSAPGAAGAFAEGGAIPPDPRDPHGRADNIQMKTKAGSYVVPKSVVDRKGTHFFDKIIAEHGDHEDKTAAHLRLQGIPTSQGAGNTHVQVSGGEFIVPKSVVDKLGTHHFDKIVAKEGDHTDRQAAEARLAGQAAGPGNGPAIPTNQLAAAAPPRVKLGALPTGAI